MNNEAINKIKYLDIIALKYLDNEDVSTLLNINKYEISRHNNLYVFCAFKVILAKNGIYEAIDKLNSFSASIDKFLYIEILSFIYMTVGEYQFQLKTLALAKDFTHGWIERAKVKANIALGNINEAISITEKLIEISNENKKFASDVYWQLNRWEDLSSLSCRMKNKYLFALSKYCLDLMESHSIHSANVYSLFNHYTLNQIELQKKIFPLSGINLKPAIGIQSDRLTKKTLPLLGSHSQKGIIGASLSHLKIIEDVYQSEDFAFVTESDSYLNRLFNEQKILEVANKKYDFILCSNRHCNTSMDDYDFDGVVDFKFNRRASGFDGYLITKSCAFEILNRFDGKPHNEHIDGKIIHWLASNGFRIGVTKHPIFSQGFCSTFSTRARVELLA